MTDDRGGSARLLFATRNAGKAREVRALIPGVQVETLEEHPDLQMPPETGQTFEENARSKAEYVADRLGVPALADDSGLEVDALGGAPGVRSARYGPGTDADRVRKLLAALAGVDALRRTARFRCAMALCLPGETTHVTSGICEGRIALEVRGDGGFGYDPVFILASDHRTMAELTREEKNARSHRAQALHGMRTYLARHFSLVQEQGE